MTGLSGGIVATALSSKLPSADTGSDLVSLMRGLRRAVLVRQAVFTGLASHLARELIVGDQAIRQIPIRILCACRTALDRCGATKLMEEWHMASKRTTQRDTQAGILHHS